MRISLKVKCSKVKVNRPINAEIKSGSYLSNGMAYELQPDGAWRPVSPTSAMTSKVNGQGRKVSWSVLHVLTHKSRTKSPRNTKIGKKVAHPTGNNAHQVRGQKVKGQGHRAD